MKLKNKIKKFQPNNKILAFPEAGQGKLPDSCYMYSASDAFLQVRGINIRGDRDLPTVLQS